MIHNIWRVFHLRDVGLSKGKDYSSHHTDAAEHHNSKFDTRLSRLPLPGDLFID